MRARIWVEARDDERTKFGNQVIIWRLLVSAKFKKKHVVISLIGPFKRSSVYVNTRLMLAQAKPGNRV